MEPNDVDCVLLVPPGKPADAAAFRDLRAGLPFIDAAIVRSVRRFEDYAQSIFASDRFGSFKGMIEVVL